MVRSLHIADLIQGSFLKANYRPMATLEGSAWVCKAAINNMRKDTGILMQTKVRDDV